MNWSREIAYVVGLAITDGCVVSKDYMSRGYVMRYRTVEWQVKDRELLEIIKEVTQSSRDIESCKRKHGDYFRFRLQGQQWVDAFMEKGVKPTKTFSTRVPKDLPEGYFWHFLRGVLDGDGNILVRKGGKTNRPEYQRLEVTLASGNEEFLKDVQKSAGGKLRLSGGEGHKVFKLEFDCGKAAALLSKLYEDSDGLRLTRKYEKWLSFTNTGYVYKSAA